MEMESVANCSISFEDLMKSLKNGFSIDEKESLKAEITHCDALIEYYQNLKHQLEVRLNILKKK